MAKQAGRRRGTWLLWVGVLLLVGGIGILGYVGYQMFVTNWASQREQAQIVDKLEKYWDEPRTVRGGDKDSDSGGFVKVDAGRSGAILSVPRFGDDYQVPILEGIDDQALAAGIGRFPDSAQPGEKGNFALAGHRVTHGEPLRNMPELQAGDELVVTTRDRVFTYVLDTGGADLTVPFTEGWVVTPRPVNPDKGEPTPDLDHRKLITLTTCSELFHTDGRLVAFGHLVSSEPRS